MKSWTSRGSDMVTMFCQFKGCSKCGGDLVLDQGDWRCWQCGQYYYTKRAVAVEGSYSVQVEDASKCVSAHPPTLDELPEEKHRSKRKAYGARSARNINAVIRAKKTSDERWWARNQEIIEYLDLGLSVSEVSRQMGRGQRQVRIVRERLSDIRAALPVEEESSPIDEAL